MEFLDNLTGKQTAKKVDDFTKRMEEVYTAMATRIVEVLDKEERMRADLMRLDANFRELKERQSTLDRRIRLLWFAIGFLGLIAIGGIALALLR